MISHADIRREVDDACRTTAPGFVGDPHLGEREIAAAGRSLGGCFATEGMDRFDQRCPTKRSVHNSRIAGEVQAKQPRTARCERVCKRGRAVVA